MKNVLLKVYFEIFSLEMFKKVNDLIDFPG